MLNRFVPRVFSAEKKIQNDKIVFLAGFSDQIFFARNWIFFAKSRRCHRTTKLGTLWPRKKQACVLWRGDIARKPLDLQHFYFGFFACKVATYQGIKLNNIWDFAFSTSAHSGSAPHPSSWGCVQSPTECFFSRRVSVSDRRIFLPKLMCKNYQEFLTESIRFE